MSTTDAQVLGARTTGVTDRERRFAACFETHYPRVLAYGLRRLPDRAAADDVAAETFLVVWRRFEDAPADVLPWLLAIARNVIRNESRSARRRGRLAERVAAENLASDRRRASGPIYDSGDDAPRDTVAVHDALDRLSDGDREILLLTSWDGLDAGQAAAALGCSRGTFAVRLHRARTRFARALSSASPSQPSMPKEAR
jgi:RNA polymerase sigma-70 factor, ECF subfamily